MNEARISPGILAIAAPGIFLTGLLVNYSLVPWACSTARLPVLHGVSLMTLLLVSGCGWLAWRQWRLTLYSLGAAIDAGTGRPFLALLGVLLSGLFFLLTLAQCLPQLIISPCAR